MLRSIAPRVLRSFGGVALALAVPMAAFAQAPPPVTLDSVLTSAGSTLQTNVLTAITAGLGIFGLAIAIRYGLRFIQRVAK